MTEWGTIAIRFALYADLMLLFGMPLFGLHALRGARLGEVPPLPFRAIVAVAAVAGLLLSAAALVLLAASMSGVPVAEVDRASIEIVATGTTAGTAWQVRIVALLLTLLLSPLVPSRPGPVLTGISLSGAIALSTLAWTGHGAATEGTAGWVHIASDIAHLLAAAAWLGTLVALILLLFRPVRTMTADHLRLSHDALAGFAFSGTLIVAIILVSGLINGWILVGPAHWRAMFTTLYGQLLLAKLLLFATMLALAAANRFQLTPAFASAVANGDHPAAVTALRRSLLAETAAAILILGLVAWLGTLAPPASGM